MAEMSAIRDRSNRRSRFFWASSDTVLWSAATFLALLLRYEFDLERLEIDSAFVVSAAVAFVSLVTGLITGLYRAKFRLGSRDELLALSVSAFVATFVPGIAILSSGVAWGLPRSTTFITLPIFVLLSGLLRILVRLYPNFGKKHERRRRTLIYGAGDIAQAIILQLRSDSKNPFWPVGIVDDDPEKQKTWIDGVKVRGQGSRLGAIIDETRAEVIVIAVSQAESSLFQAVEAVASSRGAEVLIVPSLRELLGTSQNFYPLRSLGIEDLIGRRAVDTDVVGIGSYLEGKRVLITGAGGSIGVELCKQVASFRPKELVFVDRDETGLQTAQLMTSNTGLLEDPNFVLVDIRDSELIREVFLAKRPQVVFHAAALKHLPMLERFPLEAWKTNVQGTLNVLLAAEETGVETFINISTDKAADPSSVLGRSKQIAERLTSWFSAHCSGNFVSVRFGNVLGSRGSLVPTLRHMIDAGGPVVLTHPDATRFFMTIPEACQLVLQAGAMGDGLEVFVLDMGAPVKIVDIAERMIASSGKKIEIIYSELRKGEKLHESLFSSEEMLSASPHPMVLVTRSEPLNPDLLELEKHFFTGNRETTL